MTHPSSVSRPSLACLLSSPVCRLSSLLRSGSFAGQAVACQGVALGRSLVCRLASGFTLVELMVVVAVISIMLMLLIPNIRTMREKAWSSNCQNNLRQYGIAMNQYMSDYSGYFIYPGVGVGSTKYLAGGDVGDMSAYDNRAVQGATVGGVVRDYWGNFISHYLGANVTLASLSAGEPSVRVCPVILRELHAVNYFDPLSPGFKGYGEYTDYHTQAARTFADFESSIGAGYDDDGNLRPDYATSSESNFLDAAFTTYAINPSKYWQASSNCPANVIAFIDWNAREGWNANLSGLTWPGWYAQACFISVTNLWMFTGTDAAGKAITKGNAKWADAFWLTEVGFHHLNNKVYGANYVAMDGHVGWIGSNTISITNFTTGL
ncbi:MAG: type II secretion system protein [Kiritimatiellaeota bacterium]|nr:type II secretion system protein [Kiritimatiellota bacterium]